MKIDKTVIILMQNENTSNTLQRLDQYHLPYLRFDDCAHLYIYEAVKDIFSNVILYDYPQRAREIGPKRINDELISLIEKKHPAYVIWVSAHHEFLESTFDTIKKMGTKIIAIFCDDEYRFDTFSKWWIPHIDYCTTYDSESVPKYEQLGAKVFHVIPLVSSSLNRSKTNDDKKYDVSFVGAKKCERVVYLEELKRKNIPVYTFGEEWGPRVTQEEMIQIFKQSKINLNFSQASGKKMGLKGRVLEVCLAGGFLLTEYFSGIENYFDLDKEIVCFTDAQELIDKVTYYLSPDHEKEREIIAHAGWKKACNEYTSTCILSKIFHQIEDATLDMNHKNQSNLSTIQMTKQMAKDFSSYYLRWAVALSMEQPYNRQIWKESLELSRSYNPKNILTYLYYMVGYTPLPLRRSLSSLYKLYPTIRSKFH